MSLFHEKLVINERGNYVVELTPIQYEDLKYAYEKILQSREYNRLKQQEYRSKAKEKRIEQQAQKAQLTQLFISPQIQVFGKKYTTDPTNSKS